MAFIGMRYPVVAKLASHTAGSAPTYDAGMFMGKAINANLTITRNNNPLYADDALAEDDNSISAMSLEIGLDDLLENVQVYMLGTKEVGTGADVVYRDTDASAPNVGAGYIRVRRKNGVTKYQAVWMYKVVFGQESETSQTKGESIEWQTPTIMGRAAAIDVDGSGERAFRDKKVFDTEADALTWLKGKAGITGNPS